VTAEERGVLLRRRAPVSTRVLTLRELYRATLARQMLLERKDCAVLQDEGERHVRFLAEPHGAETFEARFA
jgi:hypothetical protein